jgi:hypothetical protein
VRSTNIPWSFGLNTAEIHFGTPMPEQPLTQPLAPIAGACPPGCSFPGDADAITGLASPSQSVSIVTAEQDPHPSSDRTYLVKVDQPLKIYGPQWQPFMLAGNFNAPAVVIGQPYLVFASDNRSGLCVSTLYAYDPASTVTTFIGGDRTAIPLPGRELPLPHTITLAQVRERMYPTASLEPSTDVSESLCPE